MPVQTQSQVVTAALYVLETNRIGTVAFSELISIDSKVDPVDMASGDAGGTVHTKQFGRTIPPSIRLKRAMDTTGYKALVQWHDLARQGSQDAKVDATLTIRTPDDRIAARYSLSAAWISALSVTGLTAGDTQVAIVDVTILCDKLALWSS